MYGEYNRPKPLVQLTVHRSIEVGDQSVVQHFHEWVSPDDPRLGKPGELKFDYGERAAPAQPSPHGQQNSESAGVDREGKSSDILPGAGVPELMEPAAKTAAFAASSPPEPEIRSENSASVPGWESQQHSGKETDDDGNYGDGDGEEDDDRPWEITSETLAAIDTMAPWELEAVIENIEAHERWDELRERARERTAQRLGALKKADEAPRCRHVRMNGETCGSPAMKGQDFCYFHGEAGTNNPEHAAKLQEVPVLEDQLSLQLAISRLCAQISSRSLDDKAGRVLIAALRLAQKNLSGKGFSNE